MRYYWTLHQCLPQSYKLNHKLEVDPLVVMVVDLKCSRKAVGCLAWLVLQLLPDLQIINKINVKLVLTFKRMRI
jgi:hypothetical protein